MLECLATETAKTDRTNSVNHGKILPTVPPMDSLFQSIEYRTQAIDFDPFIDGELVLTAPATESQQEIWLGAKISDEANLACLLSLQLNLKGRFALDIFRQAIAMLGTRHESLRTTFSSDGSRILIAKRLDGDCPFFDLSELTAEAREHEIVQHQQQAVSEKFDLQRGPLFRFKILKLADRHHLIIFTIHHIICDGWSLGVIINDLAQIYTALARGIAPDLEPIEYFSEYAFAEFDKLESSERLETEAYWLQRFDLLPSIVDLPADYPRPPQRTFNSARAYHTLPADLVSKIERLGAQNGSSLMTTLLVAFEIFLFKLTGQPDLVIGVPTSGQLATGRFNLVGHCVNFLPLRSEIDADRSFGDYLQSRNRQILDDYENQDFTYGSLLKKLSISRDATRMPLVLAAFNLDLNNNSDLLNFSDLEVEIGANPGSFSTFEFFLNGANTCDGKIELDCQYNTNLYRAETIARRLAEFEQLLTDIVTKAEQSIGELSLLTATQRRQILVEWNATYTDYPRHQSIPALFEECVASYGERTAIISASERLTYRELNDRANRLANYLINLGVQSAELVGIAIERSSDTLVAILAILKAGAAYLPLDLASPPERLSYMLETARTSMLLATTSSLAKLPDYEARVICIDRHRDEIATASAANPTRSISADALAYVMYTSGSTGQPKGVAVPHRGIVRLVRDNNYADFSSHHTWLQLAPLAFDASTLEIWGSLLNGAQLVLFPGDKPSLSALGQVIREYQITSLWLTAGLFHLMVDERIEDLKQLRQLLAGGDVLSPAHVSKVLSTLPDCQLINGYGPTENTTFTCCYRIPKTSTGLTSIPIGTPIANTQVYILDRYLQPVPIGVAGELYTGGDGLALGYLHRPDLTAEKFIPNPFGTGNLYRTGDLARYLPDGTIEYLGRIDTQVKIRGFRIELGEIEAAIAQHPSAREVCAIVREDRLGDKQLAAYIIPSSPAGTNAADLRAFLQSRLPDYAIPSAFISLDALPLTANGKIDRRALPAPTIDRGSTATLTAPRDEIERQLVAIWQRILGVNEIGIGDNFFALGGNSLIAVRLFAEIERIWGRNFPLATLLQQQTIAELATAIRQQEWSPSWSSLVEIQPGNSTQSPLFCIHPVGGNILEYYTLANYLDRDLPVYGLQSQGLDGKHPPLRTVEEMASHYLQELKSIHPTGPYFLLGFSFGGLVAYEMAQQLHARGEGTALLVLLDTSATELPNLRPSLWQALGIHARNLCQLDWSERASYITDRIDYRLKNKGNDREYLAQSLYDPDDLTPQLLAVLEANLAAGEHYISRFYPGVLTLLRCHIQDLEHHLHPDLGWTNLVKRLEIQPVAGPHFTMLKEPRVRFLAAKLMECINRSRSSAD